MATIAQIKEKQMLRRWMGKQNTDYLEVLMMETLAELQRRRLKELIFNQQP